MHDAAKRSLFEAHFQIGLYIKETFVPKAYLFFMNIQKVDKVRKTSKSSSTDVKTKVSTKPKAPTIISAKGHTKPAIFNEEEPSKPKVKEKSPRMMIVQYFY